MTRTIIVMTVLAFISSGVALAGPVAEYLFESDNGVSVGNGQTANIIDDTSGNGYHGVAHLPTDGGIAMRYYSGDGTPHGLWSTSANYGGTDRWVDLGQGTFDFLDSFAVELSVCLKDVWNYLYDEEKVWHFDDENGLGSFDLRIEESYGGGPVGWVQFVHTDSLGNEYIAQAAWTAGTTDFAKVKAEYDAANGQLKIYYNGVLADTTADISGESLGYGVNSDWNYYLMGGQSDHGKTFYGIIDDVVITPEPCTLILLGFGLMGTRIRRAK